MGRGVACVLLALNVLLVEGRFCSRIKVTHGEQATLVRHTGSKSAFCFLLST